MVSVDLTFSNLPMDVVKLTLYSDCEWGLKVAFK